MRSAGRLKAHLSKRANRRKEPRHRKMTGFFSVLHRTDRLPTARLSLPGSSRQVIDIGSVAVTRRRHVVATRGKVRTASNGRPASYNAPSQPGANQ